MEALFFFSILFTILGILSKGIVIVNQYEKAVILTLGKYSYTLEPGLKIVIPIVQRALKVDMRITTADIPAQEVITKDNVPVGINAVVYFQVENAEDALLKIKDYTYAVTQYAQTALRDIVGGVELDSLLAEREQLADQIKAIVDKETAGWGINVVSIKMQDMELPADMKKSMAKQAEAERERRATIIRAQGEVEASANLKTAMDNLSTSGAVTLRTLQTIEATTNKPGNTVIYALPVEVLEGFKRILNK